MCSTWLQWAPALQIILLHLLICFVCTGTTARFQLENDEKCGKPAGGKEECYFDCTIHTSAQGSGQLVRDLKCLQDCYYDDRCISLLLSDVIDKGVCDLTDDYGYNPGPGIYEPVVNCKMKTIQGDYGDQTVIGKGTCLPRTETMLSKQWCLKKIMSQPGFIQNTLTQLIQNSCSHKTSDIYVKFMMAKLDTSGRRRKKRFAPVQEIYGNHSRTKLQFQNTKGRYPWTCSLRSKNFPDDHRCGVTLFSLPPKPVVMVGPAHCTFLCKNNGIQVPTCCCNTGTETCAADKKKCGKKPTIEEMDGIEGEIVCNRWMYNAQNSETDYIVDIKEIVRHPDYDNVKGPIGGSDIAVFKVDEEPLQKSNLTPACLPTENPPEKGIHVGWSKAPPLAYLKKHAAPYVEFYDNFFKQWHYKMDILETCQDPTSNPITGDELSFPSNSSYPKATVCAKDFSSQSCFSFGDAGSPLMASDDSGSKYSVIGFLSFVKGCDVFSFGTINPAKNHAQLNQQTENPAVYTLLSCFVDWIARQYDLLYEESESERRNSSPACFHGSGSPNSDNQVCRITPSNLMELFTGEVECIFPFYYKGVKYNRCILFEEDDFVYPIFRCPTKNVTTKSEDGFNSFEFLPLVDGYCPVDPQDPDSPLDPNKTDCSPFSRRPAFSQCKNDCPGVEALGISGL